MEYYPSRTRPPDWVSSVIGVFASVASQIDSRDPAHTGLSSDGALAALRPGLVGLGFEIESGKKKAQKIRRPVLFGELGREDLAYEVDGFEPTEGIGLEVEAGRGARGNAVYRDVIEASLLVDARYLVLAVMQEYRHKTGGRDVAVPSYADTQRLLDAIYANNRLVLPLEGVLLVGY